MTRHPRISVQLCVSFTARSVTHPSALPPCAAHFLDLNGLRGAGRLERSL
jgi:hypothetical protein